MNKILLAILLITCYCLSLAGQTEMIKELDNDYLVLKKGIKYGISKDTINVTYLYDTIVVSRFEKYLFVKQDGKWGVINQKMQNKIKCKYDLIGVACCYEKIREGKDYFIVKENNKYGVINRRDKRIIPLVYDAITSWVEAGPNAHYVSKDNKIGLIAHGGKTMIPVQYDSLYYTTSKIIKAKINGKFGVLNAKNKMIIPFEYDALIVDFNRSGLKPEGHQNKFVVKKEGKWSYIAYSGKKLTIDISDQEIKKIYAPFRLNNYGFEYIGLMFIN